MQAEHPDAINNGAAQFMEITGLDHVASKNYVEAFDGNVEAAVQAYMTSLEEEDAPEATRGMAALTDQLRADIANIKVTDTKIPPSDPLEAALEQVGSSDKEAALTCVCTIRKYCENIVKSPMEKKFLSINLENKAFNARIASVPGGVDVLRLLGFAERDAALVLDRPNLDQLRETAIRMSEAEEAITAGVGTSLVTGKVHHIESDSAWDILMAKAGSRLVVVDYFADWCGPCQRIAPMFQASICQLHTVYTLGPLTRMLAYETRSYPYVPRVV